MTHCGHLPLNWKFRSAQMSNVQRSSRSGLECQCVGSDIDSTACESRRLFGPNDLGRMMGTLVGGANFTHGATGIVWLIGVSISLNAVSGSSTLGTTETKITALATKSRSVQSQRLTTNTPQWRGTLPRR